MLAVVNFPKMPPINPNRPKLAIRRLDAWAKRLDQDNAALKKQCAFVRLAIKQYALNRKREAEQAALKNLQAQIKKLEEML